MCSLLCGTIMTIIRDWCSVVVEWRRRRARVRVREREKERERQMENRIE